jgi:hypothetical protein
VRSYDDLYKILDGFEPGEEVVVRVLSCATARKSWNSTSGSSTSMRVADPRWPRMPTCAYNLQSAISTRPHSLFSRGLP